MRSINIFLLVLLAISTIGCVEHSRRLEVALQLKPSNNKKVPPPGELAFFFIRDKGKYDELKGFVENIETHEQLEAYLTNGSKEAESMVAEADPERHVGHLEFNEQGDVLVAVYPFFFSTQREEIEFEFGVPDSFEWGIVFYRSSSKEAGHNVKHKFLRDDDYSWCFFYDTCEAAIDCSDQNGANIVIEN